MLKEVHSPQPRRLREGHTLFRVPGDSAAALAAMLDCDVQDALAVAGRTVRFLSAITDEHVVVEFLDDGSQIELPLAALEEVPADDQQGVGSPKKGPPVVVRHKESEDQMVKALAAESIQDTYRRYRECKAAVRLKALKKSEQLVLGLASDTIKQGLARHLRDKKQQGRALPVTVSAPIPASTAAMPSSSTPAASSTSSSSAAPSPAKPTRMRAKRLDREGGDVNWDEVELPPGFERRFDPAKNKVRRPCPLLADSPPSPLARTPL